MRIRPTIAAAVLTAALMPAPARADTLLIPYLGINFGGDSGKNFSEAVNAGTFNYGFAFAFMGAGIIGMETDFSFSPDFFGKTDAGGSSVFTWTANITVGMPFGGQTGFGIRPYGAVGAGGMRAAAEFDGISENNLTWDFGGGIFIFFGDRFGARVDLRYFRTFDDLELFGVEIVDEQPGKLDFTRATVGFVVRF